jgi:membrane protease YdiL (CAAX protease family)
MGDINEQNNTQEISEKKEKRQAIISLLVVIGVLLATQLILATLFGLLGEIFSFDSDAAWVSDVCVLLANIISGVLICVMLRKDNGLSIRSVFSLKKFDFSVIIAAVFGISALQDVSMQCVGVVLSNIMTADLSYKTSNTFLYIIDAIFIGPIVEEILFRFAGVGLLRDKLKLNKWLVCIVTSLIFAVLHGYGIQGIFSPFVSAVIYCCIYYRFGNIVYPIIIHILHNVAAALFYPDVIHFFSLQIGTIKNGFIIYSAPVIIIDILILIAALVYIKKYYIPKYVKH